MSSFHAVTSALAFVIAATFSAHAQNSRLLIPEPLEIEHHEIFEAVEAATRSGGGGWTRLGIPPHHQHPPSPTISHAPGPRGVAA